MFEVIKKMKGRLGDSNHIILLFELLLFSVLYGVAFRSWIVSGLMILGLYWIMSRPKGTVYMIFALSFLWGFIAFSIGHSISWGWATALGMAFLLLGLGAHMTGLKKSIGPHACFS